MAEAAHEAGLEPLQGHGIRIGSALEYLLQGILFEVMKTKGCWAGDSSQLYLRKHAIIIMPYIQAAPYTKNSSDTPCPLCVSRLRSTSSMVPGKQLNHLPNLGVPSLTCHIFLSSWVSQPHPRGPDPGPIFNQAALCAPAQSLIHTSFFILSCPFVPVTSHCIARLNCSTFPLAPS